MSNLAHAEDFDLDAYLGLEKPPNFTERAQAIMEEIEAPTITLDTRTFAKLVAGIEFYGGDSADLLKNATIVPVFSDDPEAGAPELTPPAAKACSVLAWSKNGLQAIDKAAYDLILRMTKTQPGREDDYVHVSLGAVAARLGMSTKPVSNAVQGLVDVGLLDRVTRRDPTNGHTHIYLRAGTMPVYGRVYAENARRAKLAKQKRVCESCGSTKLKLQHVCTDCGCIQQEPPHYEELVDEMADKQFTAERSSEPLVKSTGMYRESMSGIAAQDTEPTVESTVGPLVQEKLPKIYRIGPRDMFRHDKQQI